MEKVFSEELKEQIRNGGFLPCEDYHFDSCEVHSIKRFLKVLPLTLKFYLPVHLVPALIFKWKKLKTEPLAVLKYVIKGMLQSAVMFALYVALFRYSLCRVKNLRGKVDRWNAIIGGILAPMISFFCEQAGRRTELTVYMFPKSAEHFWAWLLKHSYVSNIKNGEVILFAIAMGIVGYCHQGEQDCIKPTYRGLFQRFFGEN